MHNFHNVTYNNLQIKTRHLRSAALATKNEAGHVQSAAPATKNATHVLKTSQKYCACHAKRFPTRHQTRPRVTKCHACHAKRSYVTRETSKNDNSCKTSYRHGHTAINQQYVSNTTSGHERLDNIERTHLYPQTPRVKREPLRRIREK